VFLFSTAAAVHAAKQVTVNPVGDWTPVLTRFELSESKALGVGSLGPPFTRVKCDAPSILSAWKVVQPMVRIRPSFFPDDPVISGWRPWHDAEGTGLTGLEVKRSDENPVTEVMFYGRRERRQAFPVIGFGRAEVPITWEIQIWGRYRLRDAEKRKLFPSDPEYQKLIKEKIQVVDFSMTIHKVAGERKAENIRNKAAEEPTEIVARYEGGLGGVPQSLAAYESRQYNAKLRGDYLGELRLQVKLRFPEAEEQQASAYDVPVEGYLRFVCGSWSGIRVISDEIKRIEPPETE
jgi:hypothetical protein